MTDPVPRPAASPAVDPELVALLRCPLTLEPVVQVGNRLCCYASRKAYRIEDGIPVMLVDEAEDLREDEVPAELRGGPVKTGRPSPAPG
ncbi:MAG: Trm112 family protein [Planctomycetota bacterium]